MKTWTRSDGVTVTHSRVGQTSYVRLYRPASCHIIQKQYAWYEAGLARDEAEELADLLNLEEVREESTRAS